MERRASAAIEAIYAAALNPSLWPEALQAIADYSSDVGANLIWRRDDGGFGTIASPSLAAAQADYEKEWCTQDIRAVRASEYLYWARHEAATDRHVVTKEEIASHPFYTQFLAKHGLRWVAAIGISPDPHVAVAIAIQRSNNKPEFSDQELDDLVPLAKHAENSLRLSMRLFDAELTKAGLASALTRLGIGVFVLDGLRRIAFSNPAGERLIGRGLDRSGETLLVASPSLRSAFEALISQAVEGWRTEARLIPKPLIVHRSEPLRPLALYVLPTSPAHDMTAAFLARSKALVLCIEVEPGAPADPALVRDLLGLTLSEARVAALIGSGLPPRQAAQTLGIAEETARTALKRVFSKAGVSRQSELAALLASLSIR